MLSEDKNADPNPPAPLIESPKEPKKPNPFATGCVVLIIFVFFFGLAFCSKNTSNSTAKKTSTTETPVVAKTVSPAQSFVDKKLDPLINSVSAVMDTTWQQNVSMPVDNYVLGMTTKETVNMNLNLAVDILTPKIKEIDDFAIPSEAELDEYLTEKVTKLKVNLSESVKSRIKAAKFYEKSIQDDSISNMTQEEHDNLLIDSTVELQSAVIQYTYILEHLK